MANRAEMFLTPTEITELTGYQLTHRQRDWLLQRGWLHEVNAAGRPIVLRAYAERRLSGVPQNGQDKPLTAQPNFAALKR